VTLRLRYVAHSETGLVRKNNQDSGYASPHLLVVADGMGGAAAGDLASAVAIDSIRRVDPSAFPGGEGGSGDQLLAALAGALHGANDRIADLVESDGALDGMGTTVTGAVFDGRELGLAHIGDSRAYLLRDGRLERLTHDHSWVQSLVDDGKISEEEAALHPHRSLLLKVLNGQPASDPDLTRLTVRAGDRLLLCSDGLCGLVEDLDLEAMLRHPDLEAVRSELVAAAHAAGGIDNITLIVADVVEGEGTDTIAVLGAAASRELPPPGGPATIETTEVLVRDEPDSDRAASAAAEDEARYTVRAPHRHRPRRLVLTTLALLLLLGTGLGAGYAWTRTQFYVGAAVDSVAIFQGVSEAIPGLELSTLYEVQPLPVASLPPYYQDRVRAGIGVASLEAARQAVGELTEAARRCGGALPAQPAPSATPRPSPITTVTPPPRPGATLSTSPASTPRPRPATPAPGPSTTLPAGGSPSPSALPQGPEAC